MKPILTDFFACGEMDEHSCLLLLAPQAEARSVQIRPIRVVRAAIHVAWENPVLKRRPKRLNWQHGQRGLNGF